MFTVLLMTLPEVMLTGTNELGTTPVGTTTLI